MRHYNLSISGPMIKEQAKIYADSLGFDGFKASNGWLESFKRHHNIGQLKMCGVSGAVDQGTVDDFTSKLPSICESYVADNIFNMDETGIFYCALPDKSLTVRGTDCHGGKHSKEWLTAVFCTSMTGEFIKTMVIGKS